MWRVIFLALAFLISCGGTGDQASSPRETVSSRVVGNTTIALRSGWTAVGFPCPRLTSLSAPTVIGQATWQNGAYQLAPLDEVDGRRGYYVYSQGAGNLTFSGDGENRSLTLRSGWNLVSLATSDTVRVADLKSASPLLIYDVATQSPAGDTLAPGRPLWIFANADTELTWQAAATRLQIGPADFILPRYSTRQLTVTAQLADGSLLDVTNEATWTSSIPSGAAVSATGLVTGLAPGPATLTASYGGAQATSTVNVTDMAAGDPRTTFLSVSSLPNPSGVGQTVTFTATVSGPTPVRGGTVNFNVGALTGSIPVNTSGQAVFTSNALPLGTHAFNATYTPDAGHLPSSFSGGSQVVGPVTTTTLTSSLNPADPSQSVTFTATVTSATAVTGTVTFTVDGTPGTPVALNGAGEATFTTTSLTGGSHSIIATYSGDAAHAGSTSTTLTQVVRRTSTTTVTSNVNPSALGQTVTFTITVSGGAPAPAGTVALKIDGTTVANPTLNGSGQATYATNTLSTTSSHSVEASYAQSGTHLASDSSALTQDVKKCIYVLELNNIRRYDMDGTLLATISNGVFGSELPGELPGPALDSRGILFCGANQGDRVLKLTPDGALSAYLSTPPTALEVALDEGADRLYARYRTGILSARLDGTVLNANLVTGLNNAGMAYWAGRLFASRNSDVCAYDASTGVAGWVITVNEQAGDLVPDSSGRIYAVRKSGAADTTIVRIAADGSSYSLFATVPYAWGLAMDSSDNLYVTDIGDGGPGNGRVHKVTPAGVVTTFITGLYRPRGIGIQP